MFESRSVVALLMVLAVPVFAGCGGGSSPPTDPGGAGTLRIELTDAPLDELSQINVFISGVTTKPSGSPVVRIADEVGLVDLLTVQDASELIALAGVEPGEYEFVMVELDEDRSFLVEVGTGAELPVRIPSQEIKVLATFTVEEGGETTVVLDFDAAESLLELGDGDWLMTPVIVVDSIDEG